VVALVALCSRSQNGLQLPLAERSHKRRYTLMSFECPSSLADEAAGICSARGALGCEIRRQNQRVGNVTRVDAYFDDYDRSAHRTLIQILANAELIADTASISIDRIQDPGWATMWQERFKPLPIGERLIVVPPWNRARESGRLVIVIKPGQAFGTGHHASTFGTLSMIERLFGLHELERALDVGTGSGILAIAMSKLGARAVTAIDIDPLALENARENSDLNCVAERVRFSIAPLKSIRGRFDLVTANILSSVVIALANPLKSRIRPGGFLILAGVLAREVPAVVAAFSDLELIEARPDGRWRALLLRKR
jgi:ribosomal protein L11 methyltransferase